MSDKILKEAFEKMVAIEEGECGDDWDTDTDDGGYGTSDEIDEGRSDTADAAEELTDIQNELFEIIERLDSAIRAYVPSKHRYWQSYGLAQLKIVAGSDEYATSDESINDLLEALGDNDDDNEEDDPRRGVRQR